MREHHDRLRGGTAFDVVFKPLELLGAKITKTFQLNDVVQADEVNTPMVEAIPPATLSILTIMGEIELAIIARCVMP